MFRSKYWVVTRAAGPSPGASASFGSNFVHFRAPVLRPNSQLTTIISPPTSTIAAPEWHVFWGGTVHMNRPYGALQIFHTGGCVVGAGVETLLLICVRATRLARRERGESGARTRNFPRPATARRCHIWRRSLASELSVVRKGGRRIRQVINAVEKQTRLC